jgi:hypothetical protein
MRSRRLGLSHWKNQELVNYPKQPARVNSVIQDRSGTIWISRVPERDNFITKAR